MNMKKTLAGLVASIVAVSAMATLSASAVEQKGETILIKDYTRPSAYEVVRTYTGMGSLPTGWTQPTDATTLIFTFTEDLATDISISPEDVVVKIGGIAIKPVMSKSVAGDGKPTDVATITFSTGLADLNKGVANLASLDVAKGYDVSVTYKTKASFKKLSSANAEKDIERIVIGTISGTTNVGITGAFTNAAGLTAKGADPTKNSNDDGTKINISDTGTNLNNAIEANFTYAVVKAIGDKRGAQILFTFGIDDDDDLGNDLGGPSLDYNKVDAQIKDLALAPTVSGAVGVPQGAANIEKGVATFDWDEMVKGSGLYINSIGLVNALLMGHKDGSGAGKDLKLMKVEVVIPEKSFTDPSQGEGVTEEESSIDTAAPAASEEVTTAPAAENPPTGNAPIALAVLPIAIAAAIVIAKKRG